MVHAPDSRRPVCTRFKRLASAAIPR